MKHSLFSFSIYKRPSLSLLSNPNFPLSLTMAEESQPKPSESAAAAAAETAETVTQTETETKPKEDPTEEQTPAEDAAAEAVAEEIGVTQSVSFKEESNIVADLNDPEKKALDELKQLIQTALDNKEFSKPPPPPPPPPAAKEEEKTTELKVEEEAKAEEVKTVEAIAEEEVKVGEVKTEEAKTEEEVKVEEVKTEEVKTEEAAKVKEVKAEEKAEEVKAGILAKEVKTEEKTQEKAEEVNIEEVGKEEDKAVIIEETPEVTPTEVKIETQQGEQEEEGEILIWGVPILGDEKSDTVLLKFLRARDFKVKDAMTMIKNSVIWRKQFGIDTLVNENLEVPELEKAVFYHGLDKEGHPVCYNVYGEFQDKELYAKAFGDEEKREKFLRWRIQYLEKGIREKLEFSPGGVCSMVQVTDLKNTPGPGKKELRVATKKALTLLQDNYPEFVAKQVFINVPWWYLAYNRVISPFLTQRSKSKFVFAGPSKSAETLFKYIAPEQVPVQYGGLSKESDTDFTTADAVTDVTIKPTSKHTIEIPASEGNVLVWELRVLGWELSYGAEFVPTAEDGYTVIVQKARKFLPTDEHYVKNSFKIGEPGKVILSIDNATSKKKKLLYRYKEKCTTEST